MYKRLNRPRFVYSGLDGFVNKSILLDCIGQMSDGYYENNPSWEKYWKNCVILDFQGRDYIVVEDSSWNNSGFTEMSDSEVCHLFSRVIKNTMNHGFRSGYLNIPKKDFPTSGQHCPFFGDEHTTYADVYEAMKKLEGRR